MEKSYQSTSNADDVKPSCSNAVARANILKNQAASVTDKQVDIDAGGDKPASTQKKQCTDVGSLPKPLIIFSRKVFIGGLPPDIDDRAILGAFGCYGSLEIDWPLKVEANMRYPPKGFVFLIYKSEGSVKNLIHHCQLRQGKLYHYVSSMTRMNKRVEVRPWRLDDAEYTPHPEMPYDPRLTVFIGGVPRALKATELEFVMHSKCGEVHTTCIDIDSASYPKGSARVCFANKLSYLAAISARFIHVKIGEFDRRIEVKPFVLDGQLCDVCHDRLAPFFCGSLICLQYMCHKCWALTHSVAGRENHKVVEKGGFKSHFSDLWR